MATTRDDEWVSELQASALSALAAGVQVPVDLDDDPRDAMPAYEALEALLMLRRHVLMSEGSDAATRVLYDTLRDASAEAKTLAACQAIMQLEEMIAWQDGVNFVAAQTVSEPSRRWQLFDAASAFAGRVVGWALATVDAWRAGR